MLIGPTTEAEAPGAVPLNAVLETVGVGDGRVSVTVSVTTTGELAAPLNDDGEDVPTPEERGPILAEADPLPTGPLMAVKLNE